MHLNNTFYALYAQSVHLLYRTSYSRMLMTKEKEKLLSFGSILIGLLVFRTQTSH